MPLLSANDLFHVPDVHVSAFISGAALRIPFAIVHDLQFQARREGPRDNFRSSFQMQCLQVPNREERLGAATPGAANDETRAAGTEVPLNAINRSRQRSASPAHRGEKGGTESSRLLVCQPMKAVRDQRPMVRAGEIECHPPSDVYSGVNALCELPHRLLDWWDRSV